MTEQDSTGQAPPDEIPVTYAYAQPAVASGGQDAPGENR